MTSTPQIATGIDQVSTLLSTVTGDLRTSTTPCDGWTVADLTDHLVHAVGQFLMLARGAEIDWTASAESLSDPIPLWNERTRDLLAEIDSGSPLQLGMVAAELSVHTWDLATALGHDTANYEQTLAEDGMVFMLANLTEEQRGGAFDTEKPAPEGANAYERLAAFAGRTVRGS